MTDLNAPKGDLLLARLLDALGTGVQGTLALGLLHQILLSLGI